MKYLLILFLFFCSSIANAEIVAKTETYVWTLSLELSGDEYSDKCSLNLVANTYKQTFKASLKHKYYNCNLYGPTQIIAGPIQRYSEFLVITEAAIGGDGDHTGPILRFFKLNSKGLVQIAEKEVFDAIYFRKDGNLTKVTGSILFSFCDVCDGPDAARPRDNFFVPVQITLGCDGVCISATS